MAASYDHLPEIKMVQSQKKTWIDREKSLRMVRLAQHSLAKQRLANSAHKTHLSHEEQSKSQKNILIRQIHQKLSHIQNVELNMNESKDREQVQKRNVARLESMLQRIKRERIATVQPKTVHSKQIVESRGRDRKRQNLQLMLREVSQARREVKLIKTINSQILGKEAPEDSYSARFNAGVERAESNQFFIQLRKSSQNEWSGNLQSDRR